MARLEQVDFDPFAPAGQAGAAPAAPQVRLEPVDHNPFEKTVVKRGIIAPVAEMSDGTAELAVPEIIHSPLASAKALWDRLSADPNADPHEYAGDALNSATAAITGPVGAGVKSAAKAVVAPSATDAATRLGVALPRAATGGRMTRALGDIAKEAPAPLTGNPLVQAAVDSAAALRKAGLETLEGVGTGRQAQQGVKDWMSARGASQEAIEAEAGVITRPKQMAVSEAPAAPEGATRIVTPDSTMEITARPKTAQESVFEARKATLADAIGLDKSITPSSAVARIGEMMTSKAPADVTGLLRAKKALDGDAWGDIGREVLRRSGLGDDLGAFATAYGRMTDTGKTALFGSALKSRLDDIVTASAALPRLDRLAAPEVLPAIERIPIIGNVLANRFGQAGTLGAVAMVDGGLASLPTAAGSYAVTKFLSKPQSASAVARWFEALAASAEKTGSVRRTAVVIAARNLAKELAAASSADQKRIEADLISASEAMMRGN